MRKNIAVVLAGGTGQRAGLPEPKQFCRLNGRMVLEHAVGAFEKAPMIDEIVIVSHPLHTERVRDLITANGWQKVRAVLPGGKERYDSSLAAVRHYAGQDVCLLFHDSARPLVPRRVIADICDALATHDAVAAGLPCADTIWETADGCIVAIPERARLMRAQTPQAFRLAVIEEAYRRALADPAFSVTDDCGVVLRYLPSTLLHIVPGAEEMMKLTFPSDIPLLERMAEEMAR